MLLTMRIATWNVNSIKAREERLVRWLEKHKPDVLCLQELKLEESAFPRELLHGLGYEAVLVGQRSYNGVAILARSMPETVRIGLDDGVDDPQARLIAARVSGLTFLSCYVPNGSTPDSEKFTYKLAWLDRFIAHLERHYAAPAKLVVCGDFNIAPEDRDVARPDEWRDSVLCAQPVRDAFARLLSYGLHDSVRAKHEGPGPYSWWDYRQLGFPKGNGLRIDHVLLSADLLPRCTSAVVDRDERKGKLPSDHAPVVIELDV
jgi:exodeoxyribonuclease-3